MTSSTPASHPANRRPSSLRRAFTLIELILVMALLAIAAALVAPRLVSFFRGRALDLEAQRILALTHYAQSRAIAEGVPVLLWFNPSQSTYGMTFQSGYTGDDDDRPTSYTLDSGLTLEAPAAATPPVSEQQDEKFGLPDGVPVIRFNPDGYYDEISQPTIVVRDDETALQITQTANRLAYEILPYHALGQ